MLEDNTSADVQVLFDFLDNELDYAPFVSIVVRPSTFDFIRNFNLCLYLFISALEVNVQMILLRMILEITSTGCYVVTHRVLMRREVRGRSEVGLREVTRTSPGTQTTRRLVRVPWRSIRLIWHIHQSLHCRMLSLWKISQGRVHCQDHRK